MWIGMTDMLALRWCEQNNAFVQFSPGKVLVVTVNPARSVEAETLLKAVYKIERDEEKKA